METIVKKVDSENPQQEIIKEAAELIRGGWPVAFPTETVYGLGADAMRADAARRIYEAKGRPSDNPLIIHIADMAALEQIVSEVPEQAKQLAEAFWPGPLTMILPKAPEVPYETTGGLDTVAVRMPSHPVAAAVIRAGGGFIAAPSANASGRPSPTLAEHVYEDLAGRIPLILDGGEVGLGIESTIVDLSVPVPVVLRPGSITREMLSEVIGEIALDPGITGSDENVRPKAPGMKYRHYAPKAELILVSGENGEVVDRINELVRAQSHCGVICCDETKDCYRAEFIKSIGSREHTDRIAHNLYAVLREFDALSVDRIYSETFETSGVGEAVMNRLLKAAGYHILSVGNPIQERRDEDV